MRKTRIRLFDSQPPSSRRLHARASSVCFTGKCTNRTSYTRLEPQYHVERKKAILLYRKLTKLTNRQSLTSAKRNANCNEAVEAINKRSGEYVAGIRLTTWLRCQAINHCHPHAHPSRANSLPQSCASPRVEIVHTGKLLPIRDAPKIVCAFTGRKVPNLCYKCLNYP